MATSRRCPIVLGGAMTSSINCMLTRRQVVLNSLMFAALSGELAAQERRAVRVGILFARRRDSADLQAFLKSLQTLGYKEGENLALDFPEAEVSAFPHLARELVNRGVHLIFAPTTAAAVAARQATTSIPIVFATAHDPVEIGLVKTLARPAGNVTGMTSFASELPGKRMQIFKDLIPGLTHIAVLRSPLNSQNHPAWSALAEAAATQRVRLETFDLRVADDLAAAFAGIRVSGARAVMIHDDASTSTMWSSIAALAIRLGVASNSTWDAAADAGLLFSYGPSLIACYQRAAHFVAAILNGARASDLPVEQPTHLELVLNQRTATALQVVIPPAFRLQVDRVVG